MQNPYKLTGILALAVGLGCAIWLKPASIDAAAPPHVAAVSPIAAGRYIVVIAGCNDCHTPGWHKSPGKVPESEWLTGVPVGYRGPWGTTYATNLRNFFSRVDESRWLLEAHKLDADPPMPVYSVQQMSDDDLRAMWAYIHSLGPAGKRMPHRGHPGDESTTPYVDMMPQQPASPTPSKSPGGTTDRPATTAGMRNEPSRDRCPFGGIDQTTEISN